MNCYTIFHTFGIFHFPQNKYSFSPTFLVFVFYKILQYFYLHEVYFFLHHEFSHFSFSS